jgi:hypothetical protein
VDLEPGKGRKQRGNRRRPRQGERSARKKIEQREKKNRGEREIGFPKDLYII